MANKKRIWQNDPMPRCRVAFTDSNGITHAVCVDAESLYEAVALGVTEFRADGFTEAPGAMTEFTVSIARPAIEHKVRLNQVARWAEANGSGGPAGLMRRQRVRAMLENQVPQARK